MSFEMQIINTVTGEARTFPTLQSIADFLASRADAANWSGYQAYGPLPAAAPTNVLYDDPAM